MVLTLPEVNLQCAYMLTYTYDFSSTRELLMAWFRKVKQLKHVYVRKQSWFRKIV